MDLSAPTSLAGKVSDDDSSQTSADDYEASTEDKALPFLHLPAEIRLKVYEEVFASPYYKGRGTRETHDSSLVANGVIASLVNPAGSEFAMVNKQMRKESLTVLFTIHVFYLNVWEDYDDPDEIRKKFRTTEQLLTQLIRPSAPQHLSMMTHLRLFLEVFKGAQKESKDAIVRQISTSCTSLKTFRLEMVLVPQEWIIPHEDFKHEQQTHDKFKEKTLESLRTLPSRVQIFELVSMYGENGSQYKDFMKSLFPGQHCIGIDGEYRMKWSSEIPEKVRSLVFFTR